MTKKSRTAIIAILALLAIALYFISGTYARYTSDFTGEGTVKVAKWNVSLKNGETVGDKVNITLTPEANVDVAENRIAPNSTVTGELTVDLTGTEVAVDLTAKLDENEKQTLAEALGVDPTDLTVSVEVSGAGASRLSDGIYKIALQNSEAFTAENGVVTVKVSVQWKNNDEHNATDTNAGKQAKSAQVPITLTASQHIEG